MGQSDARLAMEVLRAAAERAGGETVQSADVRLALRVLVPLCAERWPLDNYWDGAGMEHPFGRTQNLTAALNAIERQLGSG